MKRKKRKKGSRYKRGIHESIKGGVCSFRSGWEHSYLKWLDDNENVISYEYEKLLIPYVSNKKTGKIRNYIPDVFVIYSDRNELVEIKPSKRLTNKIVQKKISAALDWCSQNNTQFVIVTEIELKLLQLL